MATVRADQLAQLFVELADTLVDEFDLIDFLHTLTARTSELLDNAAAGLMLADHRGQLQFMAGTDESVESLEQFQIRYLEGPCQDCFREQAPVINADLRDARERWPRFAPRAVEAGYRSVHAFPMRHRSQVIGGLNLFSVRSGLFHPGDVLTVQALADVATIGLLQERAIRRGEMLTEQLQAALNSRVILEQAKGAIAQFQGITVDQAFEGLRRYCRQNNQRLVETARSVITDPSKLREIR